METGRPAWVEVDLAAIRHNVRCIHAHIGPRCGVLAVVKANGYGHGLVEAAEASVDAGAAGLAVALLSEAITLRQAGVAAPILVLGASLAAEAPDAVEHGVTVAVVSHAVAEALSQAAERQGRPAFAHMKIDSGMGRVGVLPEDAPELMRRALSLPGLNVDTAFTHLATADEPDLSFAREQLGTFAGVLERLRAECGFTGRAHAANSAAILRLPEGHYHLVRPGLLLYGIIPCPGAESQLVHRAADRPTDSAQSLRGAVHTQGASDSRPQALEVRPALALKARIVSIKDLPAGACVGYGRAYVMECSGRIAILPLGYADGFSRRNSAGGDVLVRGRRVPIRGRVCMDQLMVDVTDVPEAQVGDEAVLLGRQGAEEITAAAIARHTGTIQHEVLAALSTRLPRSYTGRPVGE